MDKIEELKERHERYAKMLVLVHDLERKYGTMGRVPEHSRELKELRALANFSCTVREVQPVGKVVA